MNNDKTIQDFIYSPDTVDFVVRENEYLTEFININPEVLLTQPLSGGYVVAYAQSGILTDIISGFKQSIVNSLPIILGTLDDTTLESAGIARMHRLPFYNLQGRSVLIGIVDTGIDYTQDVFRYEDGTSKIQFILDQSVSCVPPEGFYIGTEYDNARINETLNAQSPYDIVPLRTLS